MHEQGGGQGEGYVVKAALAVFWDPRTTSPNSPLFEKDTSTQALNATAPTVVSHASISSCTRRMANQ